MYISSYEHEYLNKPVKIEKSEVLMVENYYCLKVTLENAVSFDFNGQLKIFNKVLLVPRYGNKKKNLFAKLPLEVHMLDYDENINIRKQDLKNIFNFGWAALYDNISDAKNHIILSKRRGCSLF